MAGRQRLGPRRAERSVQQEDRKDARSVWAFLSSPSFSPSTILWTATSSLPAAEQGFPTGVASIGTGATAATYIYALGGNTAASSATNAKAANSAAVYFNQLDGTSANAGQLVNATWTTAIALPAPRGFAAAAVATQFNSQVGGNGTIYLLGGLDGAGAASSTVYEASLNADGSIPAAGAAGTWTTTTAMPQALFAHGAVIFHGRIYVAGGNDSAGNPVASVTGIFSPRVYLSCPSIAWGPDAAVMVASEWSLVNPIFTPS